MDFEDLPLSRRQAKGLVTVFLMISLFSGASLLKNTPDMTASPGKVFVYETTGSSEATYRVYFQQKTPRYWKGVIVSPRSSDGDSFRFRKFRINRSSLVLEASSPMTASEFRNGKYSYSRGLSGRDIMPLYIPFLQAELGNVQEALNDGRSEIGGNLFTLDLKARKTVFRDRRAYNVTVAGSARYGSQSILAARKRPHMLLRIKWDVRGMELREVRHEKFRLSDFS
ncbi:MAG: hypothetical protein ABEK01_01190 [Candidatus Nanohaloarchaea archaeon]